MAKRNKQTKTDLDINSDTFVVEETKDTFAPVLDLGGEYSKPAETDPLIDININNGGDPPSFADNGEVKQKRKYTKRQRSIDTDNPVPFVDGEMLLMFLDLLIPMGITMANNWTTGEKMTPDDLMLTEKQKSQLKKLADKVAEKIDINLNPVFALLVGMGTIYTGNFLAAKNKK